MTRKADITAQIASLQSELNTLNRVPDDTFNLGTVLVFSANSNSVHWYIRKTGIEAWTSMNLTPTVTKDLSSHIADALESSIGYFEVYELRVQPTPFFASA